jgi:hypothetical protein
MLNTSDALYFSGSRALIGTPRSALVEFALLLSAPAREFAGTFAFAFEFEFEPGIGWQALIENTNPTKSIVPSFNKNPEF